MNQQLELISLRIETLRYELFVMLTYYELRLIDTLRDIITR